MECRTQLIFLALVTVQACHSIEEYAFGLYELLPTARFASSLVSNDLATGFAVLNTGLVAFGFGCFALPVRLGWPSARPLAWTWVAIEVSNGLGHPVLALSAGGYFPGVFTAPVLLVLAIVLGTQLLASPAPGTDSTRAGQQL